MRNIKIAALQFSCCSQVQENIDKAETMVREAASNGANLILLPELFERPYFCQEKRYDYYDYALPLTENPAIRRFQAVAGELGVVIPVSFYERDVQRLFNSIAMIDADGSILGVYRKTHIPDDHFYQEKFYFTPGDTGFKVFETRFEPSASASAGISGFRKQHDAWPFRVLKSCSILPRSEVSRS